MAKRRSTGKAPAKRRSTSSRSKSFFKITTSTKVYIGIGALLLLIWYVVLSSNTAFKSPHFYVYIPRGMNPEELADKLKDERVIHNAMTFRWMASWYGVEKIRPGMYTIKQGWGNMRWWYHIQNDDLRKTQLIDLPAYRSRKRTVEKLASLANVDEKALWDLLKDEDYVDDLGGFTLESVYVLFRPGRYRIYKQVTAEELMEYMYTHYSAIWTDERRAACKRLDITEDEAVILASIVYSETKVEAEMSNIAGVYLNRLHKGMKLESDPTALFAANKMDAGRVRTGHINIDSDYNTYKRKGLPPGPITITPVFVIDQVLAYDKHEYIFFCAKDDFSGTHVFAKDFAEHKKNAEKYHKALDKRKR